MFLTILQNSQENICARTPKRFPWSLFLLKSEFLDCKPLTLAKKGQLYKGFFLNICSIVITTRTPPDDCF